MGIEFLCVCVCVYEKCMFWCEKGYERITTNQNEIFQILSLIHYQLLPLFFLAKSESDDSESDFNSVFINLDGCIFWSYIYILLNKLADYFFYQYS